MKVGDLVRFREQPHPIGPSCCGVVVEVEEDFYLSPPDGGRITIVWQVGHESYEPEFTLEVLSASR